MRVTTLIDNRLAPQLTAEWGLAFWIEYQDKHILLDTGGGENFARNAAALGIYLSRADFAVLSHAHWDHADGLPAFFPPQSNRPSLPPPGLRRGLLRPDRPGLALRGHPQGDAGGIRRPHPLRLRPLLPRPRRLSAPPHHAGPGRQGQGWEDVPPARRQVYPR